MGGDSCSNGSTCRPLETLRYAPSSEASGQDSNTTGFVVESTGLDCIGLHCIVRSWGHRLRLRLPPSMVNPDRVSNHVPPPELRERNTPRIGRNVDLVRKRVSSLDNLQYLIEAKVYSEGTYLV